MQQLSDTFYTIAKTSEGYYRDKGSKFYSFAYPVTSEEQVRTILADIKKKYYDAHHHCYAYSIGTGKELKYRINDDGEPSGSAGRPIYGQMLSADITDALIIVVRYFGGIKLGIPGLINAYKIAAKEAIDSNEIIEKIITTTVSVSCPYQNINLVMKFMKDENLNIIAQDYINEQLVITAEVRSSKNDEILDKINSIYGIKIVPQN